MVGMTPEDFGQILDAALDSLAGVANDDWTVPAHGLAWSCWQTADHMIDCVFSYMLQMASAAQAEFLPVSELHARPDATPDDLIAALRGVGTSFIAVAGYVPTQTVASDGVILLSVSDWCARAGYEVAMHSHDVAVALGATLEIPAEACRSMLGSEGLWMLDRNAAESTRDPWWALLRGSGRSTTYPSRSSAASGPFVGSGSEMLVTHSPTVATWQTMAASNNAEWCDVVCQSHGVATRFDAEAWTGRTRTPPYYPDAVTLVPDPSIPELLARIDGSTGCSVKDSYASLDLSGYGFHVLFDAHWIFRPAVPPSAAPVSGPPWEVVHDAEGLATWETAWRGAEGPVGLFRPEVLDHPAVKVLAARSNEQIVAGAVINRSASAVGISNFFAVEGVTSAAWSGCIGLVASLFPASALVGYESGADLAVAIAHGFEEAGPLRVWIREN